jgi:hypothetical protein
MLSGPVSENKKQQNKQHNTKQQCNIDFYSFVRAVYITHDMIYCKNLHTQFKQIRTILTHHRFHHHTTLFSTLLISSDFRAVCVYRLDRKRKEKKRKEKKKGKKLSFFLS